MQPLSCSLPVRLCLLLALCLNITPVPAQDSPGRIRDVSLLPAGKVRIPVETNLADPDTLLLESSSSLLGPWAKEPDFQRNVIPGGREFLVPVTPGAPQRFYRARQLAPPDTKPWIRFVSPKQHVIPGRVVNLLGERFSPVPGENMVRFERGPDSWTVAATESSAEFLAVTVPAALPGTPPPDDIQGGLPYRITVTNAGGTSNGVGTFVNSTGTHQLTIRPTSESVLLLTPPGTTTDKLFVGGGTPPYTLVPLTASEATKVSAQINGSVVTVSGLPGVTSGFANVIVRDSAPFPQEVRQSVVVRDGYFDIPFGASFRTLLGGTAPGLTLTSQFGGMQPEQMEVKFQNLQIDLTTLQPGSTFGFLRLYNSRASFSFQQLQVTEATADRVKFDVISYAGDETTRIAAGELIAQPATLRVSIFNQRAATYMPTTVDQEILFNDGIFRLPAAGETAILTATFTSVSLHPARYAPKRFTSPPVNLTITGITAGAPRLERLLPVHGEIHRYVQLRGTGFATDPAQNAVTFAGPNGTRVPAQITSHSPGELIVTVPAGAISGPVRVETGGQASNDFRFAVRFAPSMMLIFGALKGDTPVAPRFYHQQPVDEGETIGEVPPKKFTVTLDRGRLSTAGLTAGQVAGTSQTINGYTGQPSSLDIRYVGTEAGPPLRHRFEVGVSNIIFATFYAQDDPDGDGVILEMVNNTGSFRLNPGVTWDHKFTAALYRPPPAGATVITRLDAESDAWMPFSGSEMHVIKNFSQKTTP